MIAWLLKSVEIIVANADIAHYEQFLILPTIISNGAIESQSRSTNAQSEADENDVNSCRD